MEILIGPKGGKYYINEKGKKVYIKKSSSTIKRSSISKEFTKSNRTFKSGIVSTESDLRKHCCVCGKELSISDMNYYDLTNYCPKCALADGIITSLD